jgi:hypothetical protein
LSEHSYTEQQLIDFLDRIDEYLQNKNLGEKTYSDEYRLPEELELDGVRQLTQDDCFNYAFLLSNYADYVTSERAKQETVVLYCDNSLNKIVAREYTNVNIYGSQDLKVEIICRENDVAQQLLRFKAVAQSRVLFLKNKEYNIRKKIDCLIEKGKRKC